MFNFELSVNSKHYNSVAMPSYTFAKFGPGVVPR